MSNYFNKSNASKRLSLVLKGLKNDSNLPDCEIRNSLHISATSCMSVHVTVFDLCLFKCISCCFDIQDFFSYKRNSK